MVRFSYVAMREIFIIIDFAQILLYPVKVAKLDAVIKSHSVKLVSYNYIDSIMLIAIHH